MLAATNRRRFLKTSALAVAAGADVLVAADPVPAQQLETAPSAPQAARPLPIVDTHQHLWDLGRFRLPWIRRDSPLNRNFVLRDYLDATHGLNVVKAVYMEVDVAPEQQVAEAEWVLDVCRQGRTPTVAAVISGRPASAGFADYLNRFRGNRYLKGLRQVLHVESTPPGTCRSRDFVRGIRLLGDRGLSFDLCFRPAELGDALHLVEACPDTRFILDHCGNGDVQARDRTQWRRDMERIARPRHVVGKVSGILASARPGHWTADDLAPIINHTLDVFGPDRVMFGGDWPVCTLAATYRQWVEALRQIVRGRPEADRRKLFHDNAARFYGLE
jgi:predicted TIM-barrel fold metal-dependent hydrolase